MSAFSPDLDPDKYIKEMDDRLETIYKILSLNYKDKPALNNLNKTLKNRLDFSKSLLPISKSIEGELLLTLPKMWMIIILLKLKESRDKIDDFLTLVNGSLTRDLINISEYQEYFKKQCELLLDDKKAIKMINSNTKIPKKLKSNEKHEKVKNNYNYLLIRSDIFEKKLLGDIPKIKKISYTKENNETKQEEKEKKDELQEKSIKEEEDSIDKQYNALIKKKHQSEKIKLESEDESEERNDRLNEDDMIKRNEKKSKSPSTMTGYPKPKKRGKYKSLKKYKEKRKSVKSDNKDSNISNKSKDNKKLDKEIKKEDDNLKKSKSNKDKNKQKTRDKSIKEKSEEKKTKSNDKIDRKSQSRKKAKKNYSKEKKSSINNLKKIHPLTKTRKETIRNSLDPVLNKDEKSNSKVKRGRGRPRKLEQNKINDLKNKNKKSKNISTKSNTKEDLKLNNSPIQKQKKPKKKNNKKNKIEDSESESEEKVELKSNNSFKKFGKIYSKECEFDVEAELNAAMEGIDVEFDDEILNGSENKSMEMGLPADAFTSKIMEDSDSDLDLDFDSVA